MISKYNVFVDGINITTVEIDSDDSDSVVKSKSNQNKPVQLALVERTVTSTGIVRPKLAIIIQTVPSSPPIHQTTS